ILSITPIMQNQALAGKIKNRYLHDGSGHDWFHILRVRNMAVYIAGNENANKTEVELLALLHEFTDHKLVKDPEKGLKEARTHLKNEAVSDAVADKIISLVPLISFSSAEVTSEPLVLTGKIVQDADRLDAMGAIGIARTFAYGGSKGRKIYDPDINPVRYKNESEYHASSSPTINHFYEKLLLLKDMMHTDTAKTIARERHDVMVRYHEQFMREWNMTI
ncbi:MAG: HD domain-containing protein, partial [Candidatus Delongbacteria bacterium]|nr:HD domain-containing protein [Candidatus Delongbacteria bacterium]